MKIVIIGEYSSFSKNLCNGFRLLGHDCFVFSWGDSFKKIEQDNGYTVFSPRNVKHIYSFNRFINRVEYYISGFKLKKLVSNMSKDKWDIALVINPTFIKKTYFDNCFSKQMIFSLIKRPSCIFLSACGSDVPYYDYWNNQNWKNKELIDYNIEHKGALSAKEYQHHIYCSSFINKVIPIMYDYGEAWRNSKYAKSFVVYPTIPLPVDTNNFKAYNKISGKIVVFHGIIRPKAKGTDYIVSAMDKLQKKYPDKVECYAKGGMPLNDYLQLLQRTNILIDQVYAGSSGMNSLYALAMGKVLLGGNEVENAKEYGVPQIPIINIGPNSEQIFMELEKLITNPQEIVRLSEEGRKYVEKYHDSKIIAQKYIDVFKSIL